MDELWLPLGHHCPNLKALLIINQKIDFFAPILCLFCEFVENIIINRPLSTYILFHFNIHSNDKISLLSQAIVTVDSEQPYGYHRLCPIRSEFQIPYRLRCLQAITLKFSKVVDIPH